MLWQPVGDGASFHTALQRRFLSLPAKITTMKSVPAEDCAGRKAGEKGVLLKGRKERRTYSGFFFFFVMFTAPSNVP